MASLDKDKNPSSSNATDKNIRKRAIGASIGIIAFYVVLQYILDLLIDDTVLSACISNIVLSCAVVIISKRTHVFNLPSCPDGQVVQYGYRASGCYRFMGVLCYVLLALSVLIAGVPADNASSFPSPSFDISYLSSFASSYLLTLVLAPIAEELIFRKALLSSLLVRFSPVVAVIASSIAFSLLHGNASQALLSFPVGIASAVLYLGTGRIYFSIILHSASNIWSMFVASSIVPAVLPSYLVSGIPIVLSVGAVMLLSMTVWRPTCSSDS